MINVAVILPAYNEELTIAETIEAFYRELPDAKIVGSSSVFVEPSADVYRLSTLCFL